jgi:hypothetical protein
MIGGLVNFNDGNFVSPGITNVTGAQRLRGRRGLNGVGVSREYY